MTRPVIIVGGGGHCRVLVDILRLQGSTILGFTDPNPQTDKMEMLGIAFLGDDSKIYDYAADQIGLVNAIGSIGQPHLRQTIYETFKQRGYLFASVVHPSAVISKDTEIAEGVQVMAGAVVQAGATIGENVLINTRASVDHDCLIAAHSHIAPGAILSGGVMLGEGVHVGCGATILQGVSIHARSVIGAGALVLKDVRVQSTLIGVPAKEVGK